MEISFKWKMRFRYDKIGHLSVAYSSEPVEHVTGPRTILYIVYSSYSALLRLRNWNKDEIRLIVCEII